MAGLPRPMKPNGFHSSPMAPDGVQRSTLESNDPMESNGLMESKVASRVIRPMSHVWFCVPFGVRRAS
eukprot:10869486-Lingulodinium_polyedra.AAC.1